MEHYVMETPQLLPTIHPGATARTGCEALGSHPFLTVSEYQRLTGLLRTTASTELHQWADRSDSGIDIAGRGVHRVYIRKNTSVTE